MHDEDEPQIEVDCFGNVTEKGRRERKQAEARERVAAKRARHAEMVDRYPAVF